MTQPGLQDLGSFFTEANLVLLIALVAIAAWVDIKTRRIPNWLILAGLVSSLGIQIFHGAGGFNAWGLGFLVGFVLFLPLHLLRTMGAGDVKLMAMVGAFVGPASAFGMVLMTLVAGGVLAIAVALWNGTFVSAMTNVRTVLTHTMFKTLQGDGMQIELPASAGHVPYAVAIAAGTFLHILLERSGHALFV